MRDSGWRTFLEIGKVFEFGLVRDVELVEDDGYFPWVGALCFWLEERVIVVRGVAFITYASMAVELDRFGRHDYDRTCLFWIRLETTMMM